MGYECILCEKEDGVAIIKLNRPRVLNAMNRQLWLDLQEVLEDYDPRETIDVLKRLGGSGAQRIHLIVKQAGPWRGVMETLLPEALLPTVDTTALLRSAHLHTPYRLSHQESIRRRSYNARWVELTLQPGLERSNLY